MRILGIDPGTATVGYGFVDIVQNKPVLLECGVIETIKGLPFEQRLFEIGQDVAGIIAEFQPSLCVVEELFFLKNVTTGISVAEARGVIVYEVVKAGIQLLEFTPLEMKSIITGQGKASKAQVGIMIKTILQLQTIPKPDDAADALGLALCGYLTIRNKK